MGDGTFALIIDHNHQRTVTLMTAASVCARVDLLYLAGLWRRLIH